MKERKKEPADRTNSENGENEKSEDFERFENAVRRIMQMPPEEAERVRNEDSKKRKADS